MNQGYKVGNLLGVRSCTTYNKRSFNFSDYFFTFGLSLISEFSRIFFVIKNPTSYNDCILYLELYFAKIVTCT